MAHHPSAEKRNRQRIKRAAANRSVLSAARTAVKKARAALLSGDPRAAGEAVKEASKVLARASKGSVLHRRTASRKTSRLQASLHKLG
ncbi:MAG TPA: 30S ribosomal protein S20 [Polyangiaceae bacterium]|jgi:small subunit ribosomal protein S20